AGIGRRFPGLWRFVWTTNLNSSIRMSSRELDTLLVGGLAGVAAAGLYKVAKQFAGILGRFSDPLYQSIYPELAGLWAAQKFRRFKQLLLLPGLLAGFFSLFVWFFILFSGKFVLALTMGEAFIGSQPVLVWYMLAMVIAVSGFPLQPALLAMGKPQLSFFTHLGSTGLYFAVLPLFTIHYGVCGAAASYVVYYLVWSSMMIFFIRRTLAAATAAGIKDER
ncbi:MAG: hypothetical protein DRH03_05415, partial [Deltaproteobacteria bacterium]